MLALVLAADFTINRPTTPLGWIFLGLAVVSLGWILVQGTNSLTSKLHDYLKPLLALFLFLAAVVVIYRAQIEQQDPLVQGDVEVFPSTGPAAPGGQPTGPGGQPAGPNSQYISPNSQWVYPDGTPADPNAIFIDPNGHFVDQNGHPVERIPGE